MTTKEQVAEVLKLLPKKAPLPFVIAIDGRCGSGKSTLASALSKALDCGVIHMDDFFLPPALRTAERLTEVGGGVHYERFTEEILPNLKSSLPFSYRAYQCSTGEHRTVSVKSGAYFIVEGSYSHHPNFENYADLRVFLNIDENEQLKRLRHRNPQKLLDFTEKWIPAEEAYFESLQIKEKANLIL